MVPPARRGCNEAAVETRRFVSTEQLPPFDKHALYRTSVQDTAAIADFLPRLYRRAYKSAPLRLREDFSGTFALAAEWVARGPKNTAVAIDNASAPLRYGERHYLRPLPPAAQKRLKVQQRDVLAGPALAPADVACALNFSYCVFHERNDLRAYLLRCRRAFGKRGVFLLDCFPGIEVAGAVETEFHFPDFVYFWEQESFDPITRRGRFAMHFQRPGEERRNRVFRYDWRLWTAPELRDLLEEVGFRTVEAYSAGGDVEGSCGAPSLVLAAFC